MKPLHTTLRLGILLLVMTCSMSVIAQTSKTAQNNDQPVSLPSTNEGDTIMYRGDGECDTFFSRGFEEYYKTS